MAEKESVTVRLLLASIVLVFLSSCTCNARDDEREILLSLKASINSPSSWNSSLSLCQWEGIVCTNSSHVKKIELSGKNISGKISESIFHLPEIEAIDFSSNELYGEIPKIMSSCFSLRYLNLSNNNLTGPVPKRSFFGLETLDLSNNMLSGEIPEEIGLFSGMKYLDLGGNALVGMIPKSISNISNLEFLTFASNQLTGEIPIGIGLMKKLKWIYLGYNNFSGKIPAEIGELGFLNHLDLVYNNFTGPIPSSFGNLTNLQYLFLYQNKLSGTIPTSIFNLTKLVSLDLSDNLLSGEIPETIIQLQNLEILHLFSNKFSGKIPFSLTSLHRLQVLQLWANTLSGEIPKDLGKNTNLTILDLSSNNLTGKIPKNLCKSGHLYKLILFSNSLQGEIPRSLDQCKSLKRVRLQNNIFSGELSPGITTLPLVYFLDLSGNNLSGAVNNREWRMPELQMLSLARNRFSDSLPETFGSKKLENMDLSENGFSGKIPASFGSLPELMQLKQSKNKLSGKIPEELSLCKKLVNLDLSYNQLIGPIPNTIAELPVLGQLDLSMNQLSGKIPENLGKVESLVQVNISHNHFHGSLPATGAFLAINPSAVAGNDLCGGGLPPCKRVKSPARWVFIACIAGIFTAIVVLAISIVFLRRRKRLELIRVENEDGIWELQFFDSRISREISLDDILSAAKHENVLSRENNRVSYMGTSSTTELEFVVRELKEIGSVPVSFWPEMAEWGKVRHRNVVNLIGMCKSEKGGFLVYEHVEGGKRLSEGLGGLNWGRRQRIGVGIAKALRYLHCRYSPGVVVGDLSPANVIIDGKDEARLRLGPPVLVSTEFKSSMSAAYVAPEITETEDINEKSDIYAFGLILIELLTGKNPGDDDPKIFIHQSIVEWARYCYSDCHPDTWIDPAIKGHTSNIQKGIVETMNLALYCTASDPVARPCASDVAETLESLMRATSCPLVFKLSSTS